MSTLRMIIGLCLLVAPFVGLAVVLVALTGVRGAVLVLGSTAVVVACIFGGVALLDG